MKKTKVNWSNVFWSLERAFFSRSLFIYYFVLFLLFNLVFFTFLLVSLFVGKGEILELEEKSYFKKRRIGKR